MSYWTDRLTFERWIWILGLVSGLVMGFGAGSLRVALGGPEYMAGYADGRAQAHRDLADYCQTHWTEYVMPEEE